MILNTEILIRIVIFILAAFGFAVAKYIRNHKKKNTPLVCMVGFDCHGVVHSDYANFFGIPVEFFGMLYYAFIALANLFVLFFPSLVPPLFLGFIFLSSLVGLLFSIYLIGVQIFILKKGCSWCFVSAFICLAIFLLQFPLHEIDLLSKIFLSLN